MKDRDTVPKPLPHHPSLEAVCHPKRKLILNSCLFQPASPGSLYFPVCAMTYSRYLCKHHLVALALLSLLSALDLTGFQTNLLDAQFPQSLGGGLGDRKGRAVTLHLPKGKPEVPSHKGPQNRGMQMGKRDLLSSPKSTGQRLGRALRVSSDFGSPALK